MAFAYPPEMILRIRDVMLPSVTGTRPLSCSAPSTRATRAWRCPRARSVTTSPMPSRLRRRLAAGPAGLAAQRVPADVDSSPSTSSRRRPRWMRTSITSNSSSSTAASPSSTASRSGTSVREGSTARPASASRARHRREKSGKTYSLQFLAYHLETHLRSAPGARIDPHQQARFAGPNGGAEPPSHRPPAGEQLGFAHLVEPPPEDHQWARWVFDFGELQGPGGAGPGRGQRYRLGSGFRQGGPSRARG